MEKLVFLLSKVAGAFLDTFKDHGFEFFLRKEDHFNYILARIKAPSLIVREKRGTDDNDFDNGFVFNLSFDTSLLVVDTEIIKSLEVRVLGFGFQIVKQEGY